MRVKVYRNLHRNCYSVVCMESGHPMKGRVIAHVSDLMLAQAEFRVSEAGRQRVLREKRKNVHAYVIGEWITQKTHGQFKHPEFVRFERNCGATTLRAYYNPYRVSHFKLVRVDGDGQPLHKPDLFAYQLHRAQYVRLGHDFQMHVWGADSRMPKQEAA